jgi:hypothetical protein
LLLNGLKTFLIFYKGNQKIGIMNSCSSEYFYY